VDDGDRGDHRRDGGDRQRDASGDRPGTVLPLDPAPDGMELKHLRSFVAVAEELNFGRAATRLYLSQPALSRQIRALERHIGCDLLRRSTHRVELTVAGEALLDRARRVLHDVDDAVSATRAVGGEIEGRLARFWEPIIDLTSSGPDLQTLRNSCDEIHCRFPVPDVEVRPANTGGVPSLLLAPAGRSEATVLFLHGGGYVMGSSFGYRHLTGAFALAADTGVVVPEYRLAPEHPFPAALEDAVRAYRWMLAEGTPAEQITLAGDSAGAGLVLSLLMTLRGDREPLPGGAALLSPGLRLTYPDDMPAEDLAPGVSLEQLRSFGDSYLAGHPADDPIVDPLHADLHGLPPLLVQGATGDVIVEDAHRLAERARSHGVAVELELYPVDTHDFQIFWSFLPEAAAALDRAGRFAQEVRAAGADRPAAVRPS
jgi:acetyl esterase/lipase